MPQIPTQRPRNLPRNWKKMNIEAIIEKAGGWDKGDRVKFDTALLDKKKKSLKKMLGKAPNGYIKRFSHEIRGILDSKN